MRAQVQNVLKKRSKKVAASRIVVPLSSTAEHAMERDRMNYDTNIYQELGRTSRSASWAFRDADYATAIWRYPSDFEKCVSFCLETTMGVLITIAFFGVFIYGMYIWASL
jgi:hypothetical protein